MVGKIIKSVDKGKGSEKARDDFEESGQVVHKRVLDAKDVAKKIIDTASAEADKIKNEAAAVLEKAKKDRDEAIKSGYASGESKGLATVTEKLVRLEKMREKFYEKAEPEVIKLSMAVAEKVIGTLAVENLELVKTVVRQAIERSLGDRIVVRLNSEDAKKIEDNDPRFREQLDRSKRIAFRSDDSITKGGCIVESEIGTVDAQLETQMNAIKKVLLP